jgi:uncharacterized repeat protein (TIGR03943 family)
MQSCLLVLLGSTAVRLVVLGEHVRFVKPSLGPFLLVVGAALVVIGLLGELLGELRPARPKTAVVEGAVHAEGEDHGSHLPRIALLLLLPVLTVYVVGPPPLGAYAASRTPTRVPVAEAAPVPLPEPGPDGVRTATHSDYTARAYYGSEPSYEGQQVRLTGFVTPRESGEGWYLTRMTLACCAADGSPIKVLITGADGPEPAPDTWLEVVGTGVGSLGDELREEGVSGELRATSTTPVTPPENPYE